MFHVEQLLVFNKTCRENGLHLTPGQLGLLEKYAVLLLEWNVKVNLISRKDEENLWSSHLLHSVSPFFSLRFPEIIRVLDIGTGGGLPGIPMAILNPGWRVTLMDSIGKKMLAVQEIIEKLDLGTVEVVNGRAEDAVVLGSRRNRYDMVVARGVAPLVQLSKWSRPYLVRRQGEVRESVDSEIRLPALLAYKGGDLSEEVRELKIKAPWASPEVRDLVFQGSAEAGFEGKKLVIVQIT
jgi:16S rRNA (guanine527-N7)-methyltransferase